MATKDLPCEGPAVEGISVLTGEYADRAMLAHAKRPDTFWVRPKDEAFLFQGETWVTVARLANSKSSCVIFRGHVITLLENGAKYTAKPFRLEDVFVSTNEPSSEQHQLYYNAEKKQLYRWTGEKWEAIVTPVTIKKAEEAPVPATKPAEALATPQVAKPEAIVPFFVENSKNTVCVNGQKYTAGMAFRDYNGILRQIHVAVPGTQMPHDIDETYVFTKPESLYSQVDWMGDSLSLGDVLFINNKIFRGVLPLSNTTLTQGATTLMTDTKPSIKSRAVSAIKSDAYEAAWRTAATQCVSRATDLALNAMKAKKMDKAQIRIARSFFESEYGRAAIAYSLGTGLAQLPTKSDRMDRLAKELRVMGVAAAFDSVLEAGMGMLTGLVKDVLVNVPEIEENALPAPEPRESFSVTTTNGTPVESVMGGRN